MNYRLFRFKTAVISTMLVMGFALAQESGYLTQKLMVENDLRTRIREALSKIMDPSKYVVDVSVELEMSDSYEEQVTILPGSPETSVATEVPAKKLADELEDEYSSEDRYTMGLPIPGFEFEVEGESEDVAPEAELREETPRTIQSSPKDRIASKTSSIRRPARANILHQSINVIIQEGVAPEMIENIRQIVTVASQFNLERGDQLNLMTATFRERRDAKTAEQVILKSISEKIEALERKRAEEAAEEDSWEERLDRYKEDEAQRREEDREYFKSELEKLEMAARQRAFDQEKARILEQDSVKLSQLGQEVQVLRAKLSSQTLTDSQAQVVKEQVATREDEISDLDAQIEERLNSLESVQAELDRMQTNGSTFGSTILAAVLGSMLLLAIIVLIVVLMNRSKAPAYPPPPPYMYPPRRPKKKRKPTVTSEVSGGKQEIETDRPKPEQAPPPVVNEDPGVLHSEINDIRKSIVSMSVGQPETATRIVKEWIQEEAPPPPPEPETPAPTAEESEEEKPKKKKKKK